MHLWTRITQGLAALMLSAAALALLFFAVALLLGLVAVVLIAVAGLWLAAPDEARRTLKLVASRVDQWIESMRGIVDDAGALLQAVLGRHEGAKKTAEKAAKPTASKASEQTPEQTKAKTSTPHEAPSGVPSTSAHQETPSALARKSIQRDN